MEQIIVKTSRKPYGVSVVSRRSGVRLQIKNMLGAESYVLMPREVAEHLRDELTAALASDAPDQTARE